MALKRLKEFFSPQEKQGLGDDAFLTADQLTELDLLEDKEGKVEVEEMIAEENQGKSRDLKAQISVALLEMRIQKQYTEGEFQELLEITDDELAAINDFRFDPRIDQLDRICEILGMTMKLDIS